MKRPVHARLIGALVLVAAAIGLGGIVHAAPAQKAANEGREIAYTELEHHVGDEIVIQTTFDTTRRGVLTGYTTVSVSMKLGPDAGSIDLTVPKDTVRSVRVIGPAASPTATEGGSAKTN